MSPSDDYQSKAIVDLLIMYSWNEVSLVASDSNYGINAVNSFQKHLAVGASDVKFVIKSITFFPSIGRTEEDFDKALMAVKRSLTRVVILVCENRYSKTFLKVAQKMGLLQVSFS